MGNIFKVSLVGYTNAGKSSIMNSIAFSDNYVKDELFATLDTSTKKITIDKNNSFLLSDTVGFIRNLPTPLVIAFRATLEEISFSDLIVHVVDVSDEYADKNAEIVYSTLESLGVDIENKNKIFEVHNKIPFVFFCTKRNIWELEIDLSFVSFFSFVSIYLGL